VARTLNFINYTCCPQKFRNCPLQERNTFQGLNLNKFFKNKPIIITSDLLGILQKL
jgi:hypothetical protein